MERTIISGDRFIRTAKQFQKAPYRDVRSLSTHTEVCTHQFASKQPRSSPPIVEMAVLVATVLVGLELDPWLEGLEVRLEDLGAVPVACCLSAKGDGGPSCAMRRWAMDDGSPLMTRPSCRWRCSQRPDGRRGAYD